jgi:SAM-dependent methyltransferase
MGAQTLPPHESASNSEWHRAAVGGLWDEIGRLQFEFLVTHGLKEFHYLLDIGCGSLRGGVHFIRYLKPGHYFGIDRDKLLLEAGREIELVRYQLVAKRPTLVEMHDFNFAVLNQKFDFALAHSVFTHLPFNSIIRCLMNLEHVMKPGGKFFATFFENPAGKFNLHPISQPLTDGAVLTSYFDQDPYHYDFETFRWICEGTRWQVEYVGDWGHPRSQKAIIFTKR